MHKNRTAKARDVGGEHYMRLRFSVLADNKPEIYLFFYDYLPKILAEMGEDEVGLKIERLEPLDEAHVNLSFNSREKIRVAMAKFAISHGLHKDHNILVAKIPTNRLKQILKDYNLLFDLFFADVQVITKRISIEMMDGFSNRALLKGKLSALTAFRNLLENHAVLPIEAEFADHAGVE